MKINYIWFLVTVLTLVFVIGKVFGYLNWSWWLVFLPLILLGVFILLILMFVLIVFGISLLMILIGGKNVICRSNRSFKRKRN